MSVSAPSPSPPKQWLLCIFALSLSATPAFSQIAQFPRTPSRSAPNATQQTVTDWQREAVKEFPELAAPASKLNLLFVAKCNRLKIANPVFFANPQWPLILARQCSDQLRAPDASPPTTPPSAPPSPSVAPAAAQPFPSPVKPKDSPNPAAQDKSIAYSIRPEYERLGVKVRDQGTQSSCVLFGIIGCLDLYSARAGGSTQLSEQFARWADSKITGRLTLPQSGYSETTVIEGLKKFGICSADLMPYRSNSAGLPSKAALADASRRRSIVVTYIHEDTQKNTGFTDAEIDAICKSISNDQPVVCASHWPKGRAWSSAQSNTIENVENKDMAMGSSGLDGHIFVLVGYEKGANWEGGGRIEFRNSFGENWGQSGYAWLSFGFLKKHGLSAFIVQGLF